MGRDIKEKENRRVIKVLNKAEIVLGHLKDSAVKTKMDVSEAQDDGEGSPPAYANNKISAGTKKAAGFTGKQVLVYSGKTVRQVSKICKRYSSQANEGYHSINEQTVGTKAGLPVRQDNMSADWAGQPQIKKFKIKQKDKMKKKIKILERSQQGVKQFSYAARKDIKQAIYQVQKPNQQGMKTAGTSVSTSGQAVLKAAKAMENTVKNSQKMGSAVSVTKNLVRGIYKITKNMVSATRSIFLIASRLGSAAVALILMVVLFGSVLSVSGGNNGETDNLISDEVRQYESIIWHYASQYGIEDYTELIKAVMMQESGGRGQDPMQSSECGYNNR